MGANLRVVLAAASDPTSQDLLQDLDHAVMSIFEDLVSFAVGRAAASTEAVLEMTKAYVSKPARDAITEFHALYFPTKDKPHGVEGAGGDDLFETVVQAMDEGRLETFQEDEDQRRQRMALATVQKRLEALMVIDQGLRQDLVPTVASMQFEDAMRQRLKHLTTMWAKAFALQVSTPPDVVPAETLDEMARLTSSLEESRDFYRIVLGQEIPPDVAQGFEQGQVLLF